LAEAPKMAFEFSIPYPHRNVRFAETVDVARRLELAGVEFEELVIPDDTQHFMRLASWVRVNEATADFLDRKFGVGGRR
jgi:dipeptidyl aminopeptidase/acylaminoacyl peptidase